MDDNRTVQDSVIAEAGSLIFTTRKEWYQLPEPALGDLKGFSIEKIKTVNDSIMITLRNCNPNHDSPFMILKICGTGKNTTFYGMDLSSGEREQIRRSDFG